jgi:hypothetical protein
MNLAFFLYAFRIDRGWLRARQGGLTVRGKTANGEGNAQRTRRGTQRIAKERTGWWRITVVSKERGGWEVRLNERAWVRIDSADVAGLAGTGLE